MELVDQCMSSQKQRITDGSYFKQYFYSGSDTGKSALYNRCFPHIDRLASYLFSPSEVHFQLTQDTPDKMWMEPCQSTARYLSYEFHRTGMDIQMSHAVEWALVKGSSFIKTGWGHDGFEGSVVQPECMGVLREDICGLDRQEAFNQQIILTKGQFARLIDGHPHEAEIWKKIRSSKSSRAENSFDDSIIHQIIIGGVNPVTTAGTTGAATYGMSQVFGGPVPQLAADVKSDLILLNELWVMDDEREDWTTIQYIDPDIVIEGELRRRNMCGIKGETPFTQVNCNQTEGYFWGRSELAPLVLLQDTLNRRMMEVDRISRLRAKPPQFITGATITEDQKVAMSTPGGFVSTSMPNATAKSVAPELPPELFEQISQIINFYDDIGGFEAITKGQGESGVRSQAHAETLVRTATPRLRDRALQVERQCGDVADFCLKLLQNKIAREFTSDDGQKFLLDQLPEGLRVSVDSHSSSPAFSNEAKQTALELFKTGAITAEDYIMLTHPPGEDILMQKAKERAKGQAEEHKQAVAEAKKDPSLWGKILGRKK